MNDKCCEGKLKQIRKLESMAVLRRHSGKMILCGKMTFSRNLKEVREKAMQVSERRLFSAGEKARTRALNTCS